MEARSITGEVYKINLSEHLRIGQRIKIDAKHIDSYFYAELIGFKYDQYILISAPASEQHQDCIQKLKVGDSLVVRTIFENTNGDFIVFKSNLLTRLENPEAMYVLSFPVEAVTRQLRKEPRQQICLDASISLHVQNEKTIHINGNITDLSDHGCCFEFFSDQFKKVKHSNLSIEFTQPDGEVKQTRNVQIKHQRRYGNKIVLGLGFEAQAELFEEGLELDYESDYLNYTSQTDAVPEVATAE